MPLPLTRYDKLHHHTAFTYFHHLFGVPTLIHTHTSEQMSIPAKLFFCQQHKPSSDCSGTWKVFTNRKTSQWKEWPLFASHFWLSSPAASWEEEEEEALTSSWDTLRACPAIFRPGEPAQCADVLTVFTLLTHCLEKTCPIFFASVLWTLRRSSRLEYGRGQYLIQATAELK